MEKAPERATVNPVPVIVEPDFGDPLTPGEQETVAEERRRSSGKRRGVQDRHGSEHIIRVGFHGIAGVVGEGDGAAEAVVMVVNGSRVVDLCQNLIDHRAVDVGDLKVSGIVQFFNEEIGSVCILFHNEIEFILKKCLKRRK